MANEVEEFVRSHAGGWGRIPLPKMREMRTFKVMEFGPVVDAPNTRAVVEIITQKGTTKVLQLNVAYLQASADWYIPESKFVNTDNYVVRSVAYPKRQFAKVLTNENIYFAPALTTKPPDDLVPYLRQSILDIMDGYGNSYPSYAQALENVNGGQAYAKAFGKRFLISIDAGAKFPVLVYRDAQIGYDRGDAVICFKKVEAMHDVIQSVTKKPIIFQEAA